MATVPEQTHDKMGQRRYGLHLMEYIIIHYTGNGSMSGMLRCLGTGGKAVWAMSCFMFALVQRTMAKAGGAWICAQLPSVFYVIIRMLLLTLPPD